jgi:hypothetical protein
VSRLWYLTLTSHLSTTSRLNHHLDILGRLNQLAQLFCLASHANSWTQVQMHNTTDNRRES